MSLGMSTACFYPELTADALLSVARSEIKICEIFFNSPRELKPEFLDFVRSVTDEYGIKVKAVHPFTSGYEPFLLFSEYHPRFEDTLEFYRQYFSAAAYIGADYVILHGDNTRQIISEEEYFRRFGILFDTAAEYGVLLCQENVNNFRSQDPQFIRRMRNSLKGRVRFVLDVKQCIRSGCSVYDMADAMGEDICHVHISGNSSEGECMLPHLGTFDLVSLLKYSPSIASSDWIIEVYRSAYSSHEMLLDSYRIFEKMLDHSGK